jgi:hypothetical protein
LKLHQPPTPSHERARDTERLIQARGTDVDRWANPANLATQWDARAALAGEAIPAGSRVLDVGAGAMTLGRLLKPGCVYQAADVVSRGRGCLIVNLNAGQFPSGAYDYVTFLGVLEYVHDVDWVLTKAKGVAPRMIVTYCTFVGNDVSTRRGMGWVNDFTEDAFVAALTHNGWVLERKQEVKRGPNNIQLMFECSVAA